MREPNAVGQARRHRGGAHRSASRPGLPSPITDPGAPAAMKAVAVLATALLLTACASTAPSAPTAASPQAPVTPAAQAATVVLAPASGSLVSGRLDAMAMAGGVHFTG